jgi:hypothetical protein
MFFLSLSEIVRTRKPFRLEVSSRAYDQNKQLSGSASAALHDVGFSDAQ